MRKRMHLRLKRKNRKANLILFILISLIIILGILFYQINKRITPTLMSYAEFEVNKIAGLVINLAVVRQFKNKNTVDQMFVIQKNKDDEIQMIDFKTNLVNENLTNLTNYVYAYFKNIENGEIDKIDEVILNSYGKENLKKGIICQIPIGLALNKPLFSNFGPKIPVRLTLVGDISSNLKTKITDYGINNALLEISVHIEVANRVLLPLLSKKMITKTDIPIVVKVIQGKIPSSYLNTVEKNSSSIMVPVE